MLKCILTFTPNLNNFSVLCFFNRVICLLIFLVLILKEYDKNVQQLGKTGLVWSNSPTVRLVKF